jgi:hypothetical protein
MPTPSPLPAPHTTRTAALRACAALVVCAGVLTTLLGCCCGLGEESDGQDPGLEYEMELSDAQLVPPEPLECRPGEREVALPTDARTGSGKALLGTQLTIVAFVQPDAGSAWTPDTSAKARAAVERAHRYLEREAARYGQTLTMKAVYKFERAPHTDAYVSSSDWREQDQVKEEILKRLAGKQRVSAWREALRREHGADGVHLLLLNADNGRAYAQNMDGKNTDWAMLYNEGQADELAPVIAHEVMHLYGAHDLYNEPGIKRALRGVLDLEMSQEVASRWPGELMLSVGRSGEIRNYIGPYSAWIVGWSACTEPYFQDYRDGQLDVSW